jgi:hypothetical protein
MMRASLQILAALIGCSLLAASPQIAETPVEAAHRHQRVAQHRTGVGIICHRGASEFAHENTLEAYRATLELGGDGNEIDIRTTKDGVLVCLHDDTIEAHLKGFGDVADYTWDELQRLSFRNPGQFGPACRIPTLVEVFELHRQIAGLLHLDIKRPSLDVPVAALLDRMDMWDHVAHCNTANGDAVLHNPKYQGRSYKGQLYEDHAEVDEAAIKEMLKKRGDDVIVDDPRGVAVALGRPIGKVSAEPVAAPQIVRDSEQKKLPAIGELLTTLKDAGDWDKVAATKQDEATSAARIIARARAADLLLERNAIGDDVFAVLEDRVQHRSLHKDWQFHGLDGAMALRSLILLHAPRAVELARQSLWRDDPALAPVVDPRFGLPRAWTDFRIKQVVFAALEHCPGAATEQLCHDYLALSEDDAKKLGPPLFDSAARTLLAISPRTETAIELMHHNLRIVRGRCILDCLALAREPWAREALRQAAPHALAYGGAE